MNPLRRSFAALRLALFIGLFAPTGASAQSAIERVDDFGRLAAGRTLIIVDDDGLEIRGRVLQLTPEGLTMTIDGQIRTLAPSRVARVFVPGDSVKNGAAIGFLPGLVIGLGLGSYATQCGKYWPKSCPGSVKAANLMMGGLIIGGLSAAIGAGIDAIIAGRRLVYERPKAKAAVLMSLTPSIAPSRIGLSTSVSW
jgi:hypothetical protein